MAFPAFMPELLKRFSLFLSDSDRHIRVLLSPLSSRDVMG